MPATYTPIRYPGDKTKIYPLLKDIIDENGFGGRTYAEAFAGGAGLAMKLLLKGRLRCHDQRPRQGRLLHMECCCQPLGEALHVRERDRGHGRRMEEAPRDLPQPEQGRGLRTRLRRLLPEPHEHLGDTRWRCHRRHRATGRAKVDARFSKPGLLRKIRSIAKKRGDIRIFNLDAEEFIADVLAKEENLFAYFDPPYVKKDRGCTVALSTRISIVLWPKLFKSASFPG